MSETIHPQKQATPQRKPKLVQQHIDSITRVNPERTHGLGLWGNKRVVFGVRVDERLALAFVRVAKAKFGSTCNPIESFMASVVGCYQNPTLDGVNPSITIGEIKIERNLRERRKVEVVTRETTESVYSRMDRNLASLKAAGAKETVVRKPRPKPSGMSLEDLQREYDTLPVAQIGRKIVLAGELKRRGVLDGSQ